MFRRTARLLSFAAALLLGAIPAFAQLEDNLGGMTATNAKAYLDPLPSALSSLLTSAVFTTGKVPQQGFGCTVGIRVMGVAFADDDRTYHPTDPPGFTSTGPVDAPTVVGDTKAVAQSGAGGTTMFYPGGFDLERFEVAAPQLNIGSVMGTRAIVRFISVKLGDNEIGDLKLFGIGGQHSISQYFEGLPVDLAAGIFYQSFKIGDDLVDTKALQLNVTGSKSFGMLQPYVGIGYDSFDMDVKYEDSSAPGTTVEVNFDKKNNAHLTAGLQFGLPLVKINVEGNLAAVNGAAIGLSFGL